MAHFIGVDVGTGSVRTAVVDCKGNIVATNTAEIKIWNPTSNFYEQSSTDIWNAVIKTVRGAMEKSGVSKECVSGIGFDATCSLVVLNKQYQPLSISQTGLDERNVVMWMDHRAASQASFINDTKHNILQYVGGKISLEMQTPKLLWLKQNMKDSCWDKAGHFFDLPDFLTWKATGSLSRSQCSLVCKWGYTATNKTRGWSQSFMKSVGLEDLNENDYAKIGNEVKVPGEACGSGLSAESATELGLLPATAVATSIIDAYAGAIGCLGCEPVDQNTAGSEVTGRLAVICGTSTCHMLLSSQPVFVPGVWGPYNSAMIPGYWTNEGGQSATGKLIDFVVESHSAFIEANQLASDRQMHIHDYLNDILSKMAETREKQSMSELTEDFHMWPDYHGNRSPLADSSLKGMICGLTLSATVENLALLYLATVQALAYGTRHILEAMNFSGHKISAVYICGGLRKNSLFVQTNADVVGLPTILPDISESVLLGSAILGACASGTFPSIEKAMKEMGGSGTIVSPDQSVKRKPIAATLATLSDKQQGVFHMHRPIDRTAHTMAFDKPVVYHRLELKITQTAYGFHDKKYKVFLRMLVHQREYQNIMART